MLIQQHKPFLYFLVAINVLPHAVEMPEWITIASLLILVWSFASDLFGRFRPHRWIVLGIAIFCVTGVLNQFGVLWGDTASSALLMLLVSLKTFELRSYRDMMVVTYLCFFLLMTKLISSQSIPMTVFMFCDAIALLSLMVSYHSSLSDMKLRTLLRRAFQLTTLALPILFVFFVLFPRFQIGLFNQPQQLMSMVGFSDELKPGSMSQLIQSEEIAFRVSSDEPFPDNSRLYWRGSVLDQSWGLEWRRDSKMPPSKRAVTGNIAGLQRFEYILEPGAGPWLFVLDYPVRIQFYDDHNTRNLILGEGLVSRSRVPILSRTLYIGYSQEKLSAVPWQDDTPTLSRYLELQGVNSPRAQVWINQMLRSASSENLVIARILDLYRKDFRYSLQPPLAANLDDFLFESKIGFCEHFAASMATLLRMAKIPARVVVGFQGGLPTAFQNFMTVRMMDAHAWVEYWSASEKLWRRVDPTAVVAPQRLQLGSERFASSMLLEQNRLTTRYPVLGRIFGSGVPSFYLRFRSFADQAESSWINFLLRYDLQYQRQLFRYFGVPEISKWGLTAVLILAFGLVLGLLYLGFQLRRDPIAPELAAYRKLLRKLKRKGLEKGAAEGPLEFETRVLGQLPSKELAEIFRDWRELRYTVARPSPFQIAEFRRKLRSLRSV